MFSGCTVPPDSKETKLGSSDQEASPSAGKNTGIVFVPCCTWKCIPTAIYSGVDISEVSGCHLLQQLSSQWGHKNYFKDWCHELTTYLSVLNLFLTQCIMVMLSEGCKLDNFEPQNSLKHSCVNIWGLCSNFVECGSFLESNSLDILALCETNMDDSIDSGNFSVRGYLPLIQKDSSTHLHDLSVYVKEGLPFAQDLSLENSADSYLCFRLTYSFWFYFI